MRSKINIHNMDCMDAMKGMKDNQFDLAIVDVPYRDAKDNDMNKHSRVHIKEGRLKNWQNKPKNIYFDELRRISKNQIIWGANNFQLPQFKGFVVWKKKSISENFTMSMCEIASLSEELGTISKWIEISPQGNKDDLRIHPTQKPIQLYRWLLRSYAKEGDKILDTHLGSGSIAIACWDLKYDLTAYEIDKEYYDNACKRFNTHCKQEQLF